MPVILPPLQCTEVVVLLFKNLRWRPWFWAWDIRPGTCLTWQNHINCYIICNVEDEVVLKVIIIADVLPMFRFWWWYGPESVRLYPAVPQQRRWRHSGGIIPSAMYKNDVFWLPERTSFVYLYPGFITSQKMGSTVLSCAGHIKNRVRDRWNLRVPTPYVAICMYISSSAAAGSSLSSKAASSATTITSWSPHFACLHSAVYYIEIFRMNGKILLDEGGDDMFFFHRWYTYLHTNLIRRKHYEV